MRRKHVRSYHILLLPGDGIGPEVVLETVKVMAWFSKAGRFKYSTETGVLGGAAYEQTGDPFPAKTVTSAKKG